MATENGSLVNLVLGGAAAAWLSVVTWLGRRQVNRVDDIEHLVNELRVSASRVEACVLSIEKDARYTREQVDKLRDKVGG
jgi:hypothetical protein